LQDYFIKVHKFDANFIELESEGILHYDFRKKCGVRQCIWFEYMKGKLRNRGK